MTRIIRSLMLASAVAGVMLPGSQAAAQSKAGKPTLAILNFNNNVISKDARDYDGLNKGIADVLITEMSGNPNIRVIERDQIQKLLDEQHLVTDGQIDRATAVKVGKLLGMQHVIFGGFMGDAKGNFRIDARSVNVETGEIEHTERVQDKSDNVMTLITQLASKLNDGLKLPATSMRSSDASVPAAAMPAAAARPVRLSMTALVQYGKALDMKDHGNKAGAVELFNAVLDKFPDYEPARREKASLSS